MLMGLFSHHLLPAAVAAGSITGSLTRLATSLVTQLGLGGIFALMLLDCACIPVPSEVTMMFAGFSVSEGHYGLAAVIVAGVLGNVVGSLLAYGVGLYGNDLLRHRASRRLLVHERSLQRAQGWFARYGAVSVFFSRMLPLVRTFISLPAGLARMGIGRFTLFTALGCIPWVVAWALIGDTVGRNWTHWRDQLHYVDDAVLALLVIAVAWLLARWIRGRLDEADNAAR